MKTACPGKWRYDVVFGLLMLTVSALGVRLWFLMRGLRPSALRLAERQQLKTTRLPARGGNIYVNRNIIGAVVGAQPFGGERLSGTGPKAGGPHLFEHGLVNSIDSCLADPL